MRLDQILKIDFINDNLLAGNKDEVLAELAATITNGGLKIDKANIIDVLRQREKLGSTGIGEGVAIPHGKIGSLEDLTVSFGRSKAGVSFDSMDGKPVHLFFLLLAPENSSGQHLKALAKISKMLKVPDFRKNLMEAKTRSDLYKIIIEQDEACPV
jgi:PTS system nitrogen regulatory IIA component